MAIIVYDFPDTIARRAAQSWEIDDRNISGPKSISGFDQVVFGLRPVWTASLSINMRGFYNARSFQAFRASLRGRARGIRIHPDCCVSRQLYERLGAPYPTDGAGTTFSDGSGFSDGSLWAWPVPVLIMGLDAQEGDETIVVNSMEYEPGLQDGDLIGIDGSTMHRITHIEEIDGAVMTIGIQPPLRAYVPGGAEVTTRPSIVMRMTDPNEGKLSLGVDKVNNTTLNLEEWVGLV